jgi:hypothetical protein
MTATGISLMHAGPNHAAFETRETGIDHTAHRSPAMHRASCAMRSAGSSSCRRYVPCASARGHAAACRDAAASRHCCHLLMAAAAAAPPTTAHLNQAGMQR